MSGRCERVYVRLTPGEKDRAHYLTSRGIWRMSSLMEWSTALLSCIWCPRVATRPKESRPFDGASREIPVVRRMRKAARGVRPREAALGCGLMKKGVTGSATLRSQTRGVIHLNDNVYNFKLINNTCFAVMQGTAEQ